MTSTDPAIQAWFNRARAHAVEVILAKRGYKLPLGSKNERKGPCPVCGGEDRFGLNISKQTFTCHQCGLKGAGGIDILVGIGKAKTPWEAAEILEGSPPKSNGHDTNTAKSRLVATWIYRDVEGKPYLKVDRLEKPDGSKSYPQSRWEDGKWVYGKPAGPKIPYRLPELLDSDRTEPVYICEGEKCALAVVSLSLAATSASEGAEKWTPDLNEHFRDRIAYILPDNDEPGRKHAELVAQNLTGIAREVRIVPLPGLADGEDVYDWIKRGGTREQLDELGDAAPTFQATKEGAPSAPYVWVNMSDWDDQPRPHEEYTVPGRIPLRQAMLFSGEGGGGKSTVIKQLCAGTVLHQPWLGALPQKGPAFFIEAEDEERIMHARMYDICLFYKANFRNLIAGGLHMISRAGEDSVMATSNRDGKIVPTHFYNHILERAGDIKPKIIGIASAANVFAGNEISRPQVQQFSGLLTKLAQVANGSVVLAMHPSLTGINTGTGLSGTTQWHNAFRARAYLDIPKLEGGEPDPAVRELRFLKNQYGRRDETISLQYQNGLFLPISPSGAGNSPFGKISQDAMADDVFLTLLRRFTRENRNASHSPGNSYAPSLFAQEKDAGRPEIKDPRSRHAPPLRGKKDREQTLRTSFASELPPRSQRGDAGC